MSTASDMPEEIGQPDNRPVGDFLEGTADDPVESLLRQRLTEEQIEHIATLLRAGRRLPPHLFPHLFESPREYELAYRGKSRASDILAETMAVPLQSARAFGGPVDGWSNMLVFGDNLQVLRQLLNLKDAGQLRNKDGSDGVRLCYIDPPFATEREFQGGKGQAAYSDKVAGAEFVESLRKRLILIRELLADDGTLYVHLDWKKGHYVKVILDEIFGPSNFRNEIVWWYYNKYQGNINRFPSNHDTLYVYGKGANPVFNTIIEERENVARFIQRVWDPKSKKLVNAKDERGRVLYVEREDRRVDDVWRLSMLQPADRKEKVDFPTQKPESLVSLVVAASSNEGDLVLDAFVGSGTTPVVAERLGRRWIAIDSGKFAIYVTQARLLKGAERRAATTPFTLYNAGLYDYVALRELPRAEYVEFVLQLFQCRGARNDIGGVTFHGFIGDDPVLVYDFKGHPDAQIGEDFVQDLADICRGRLGSRCFIIAPASAVAPYEDYLTVNDTRFFFLRIPYSIIAELHKRAFSDLHQPTSEARTNAFVDAVGFDFIQPPQVECSYTAKGDFLEVGVLAFESEAFAATPSEQNIADLAMVLVDYAYDNEVFNVSAVHFADDLAKEEWRFRIPRQLAGERIMLVYVDLYGNEHREVCSLASFGASAKPSTARRRAGSSSTRAVGGKKAGSGRSAGPAGADSSKRRSSGTSAAAGDASARPARKSARAKPAGTTPTRRVKKGTGAAKPAKRVSTRRGRKR